MSKQIGFDCKLQNNVLIYILVSQVIIGNVDIKTKSVHFYVQRSSSFGDITSGIPFELARLNEGGGMTLYSGVLKAPVAGIYHFAFSGIRESSAGMLDVYLQVNGENVGLTNTYGGRASLTASLRLKAGDEVRLYNYHNSILYDDQYHRTHFTGWLVEEDLLL